MKRGITLAVLKAFSEFESFLGANKLFIQIELKCYKKILNAGEPNTNPGLSNYTSFSLFLSPLILKDMEFTQSFRKPLSILVLPNGRKVFSLEKLKSNSGENPGPRGRRYCRELETHTLERLL
jgi:hypothetical protein